MDTCDNCRFWRRLTQATGSCYENEELVIVTEANFACGNQELAFDVDAAIKAQRWEERQIKDPEWTQEQKLHWF